MEYSKILNDKSTYEYNPNSYIDSSPNLIKNDVYQQNNMKPYPSSRNIQQYPQQNHSQNYMYQNNSYSQTDAYNQLSNSNSESYRVYQIRKKIQLITYITIAFFVWANPVTYKLLQDVYTYFKGTSLDFIGEKGTTLKGLLFHTLFFLITLVIIIRFFS